MFNRKFFTLLSLPIFFQCGNPKEQNSNNNEGVTLNDKNNIFSDQLTEFKIKLEKIKICSKDSRGKKLKELEVKTVCELFKTLTQHVFSCVKKHSTNHTNSSFNKDYADLLNEIKNLENMITSGGDEQRGLKKIKQEFFRLNEELQEIEKIIVPTNLGKFKEEITKIGEQFACAKNSYDCLCREFCSNYL